MFDLSKRAESKLIRRSNSDPTLIDSIPATVVQESSEVVETSGLLNKLPEMQRQAIEYRYLKEWSFEKIAEEMQTTSRNIRQLVSRGLKKARLSAEKKEA